MSEIKNRKELSMVVQKLQDELNRLWENKNIDAMLHKYKDLEIEIEHPNFWDNQEEATKISQKKSSQEKFLSPWIKLKRELSDLPELIEMSYEEYHDDKIAIANINPELQKLQKHYDDLLVTESLMEPDDQCNAIITITPGAGGTESQDWASMLLRMYLRWAEQESGSAKILDLQDGEKAGIKSASLLFIMKRGYGRLKSENGIHRLVRISPFDSNKRRHTSFVAVHVMPEINDQIDLEIDEKELRVDTYRASGAGGQHVNKTDSAIRITHLPTNTVVQCQSERSQHKNRASAMKLLKSRLYEKEKEKHREDMKSRSGEKKSAGWGNQVRSYVLYPYKMVKDLRTGYETSDVDGVMDGNLNPFIESYLKRSVSENAFTKAQYTL